MNRSPLENILFVDIETIRAHKEIDDLEPRLREQWDRKFANPHQVREMSPAEIYREKAGLLAEFGKIIVIGLGFFTQANGILELRLKSLAGDDEKELLTAFTSILKKFDPENLKLCAHNGRNFDFPYLSRRILINQLRLPGVLQLAGKKPWEINHLDTMEMWRFGDYRHYTSLDLLAALFNIPTSKSEMDGSQVGEAYHEQHDLEAISRYCLSDVEVTARIYLQLSEQHDLSFKVVKVD